MSDMTKAVRERTVIGWTFEQWALMAGQCPGQYRPTTEDALRFRRDWLTSMRVVDKCKHDHTYAEQLFHNAALETGYRRMIVNSDIVMHPADALEQIARAAGRDHDIT